MKEYMCDTIECVIDKMQKEVGNAYPKTGSQRDGHSGIPLGHCKRWIQVRIKELTGIVLPQNIPDVEKKGQWWDENMDKRITRVGVYQWIEDADLKRGDIVQLQYVKKRVKGKEMRRYPWHTCMCLGWDGKKVEILDANYVAPFTIGEHDFTKASFNRRVLVFTVYRLNI